MFFQVDILIYAISICSGVTEFCGTEAAFVNYPMSAGNLDSRIIDRFIACFGPRLSRTKAA